MATKPASLDPAPESHGDLGWESGPRAGEYVIALVYMLLRDDVPVGRVTKIVRDIQGHKGKRFDYSHPELEALARRLVMDLW